MKVEGTLRLGDGNHPALPAGVPGPGYDRTQITAGIAHFGVGGFHRAHQAMYVDKVLEGGSSEWGICGIGVMESDHAMQEALESQDCLYTLVTKDSRGDLEPRVIGSIVEYLFAPDHPDAVVERLADPAIRIVSMTVTEGGYNLDPSTGEFDLSHPDVQHDLQHGAAPKTTFGLVAAAVERRRERGIAAFTLMSCDNIPGNGDVARRAFGAFASAQSRELGAYLQAEVRFPNSMVDRITPATTDDDRADLARHFGIDDSWPVVCEPFAQWVLEDSFASGRPAFEKVGVQLVSDVTPYELMKLRLLNVGHQALAYFGYLAGYRMVHEVAQDGLFADFLLAYMDREATPTLGPVPGIDLDAYKPQLLERFANAALRDTVGRLCEDTSDRIPTWLLPVIRHNLEHGGQVGLSAAIVASWARYAEGTDEEGKPIEVVDRLKETLTARAKQYCDEPLAFLENRELFGDLADNETFTAAYLSTLDSLHSEGARATLKKVVNEAQDS